MHPWTLVFPRRSLSWEFRLICVSKAPRVKGISFHFQTPPLANSILARLYSWTIELLWSCIMDGLFPVRIPIPNRLFPCLTKRPKSRLEKMVTIVGDPNCCFGLSNSCATQAHVNLFVTSISRWNSICWSNSWYKERRRWRKGTHECPLE